MMQVFHIDSLTIDRQTYAHPFDEFLRTPHMSVGLYHLDVEGHDEQGAHQEDVLFHVIRGAADMWVGDTELAVTAGSVVLVPAGVPPRFVNITEALDVLFVFAPAETSPTMVIAPSAG